MSRIVVAIALLVIAASRVYGEPPRVPVGRAAKFSFNKAAVLTHIDVRQGDGAEAKFNRREMKLIVTSDDPGLVVVTVKGYIRGFAAGANNSLNRDRQFTQTLRVRFVEQAAKKTKRRS